MNRDTAEGKFDQIKGKAKQSIGEAFGNDKLANSGAVDQVKGAAKEAWGNAKDAAQAVAHDAHTSVAAKAAEARAARRSDRARRPREDHLNRSERQGRRQRKGRRDQERTQAHRLDQNNTSSPGSILLRCRCFAQEGPHNGGPSSFARQHIRREEPEERHRNHAVQREERRVHPPQVARRDDAVLIQQQRRHSRNAAIASGPRANSRVSHSSRQSIPRCIARAIQNAASNPNACGTL